MNDKQLKYDTVNIKSNKNGNINEGKFAKEIPNITEGLEVGENMESTTKNESEGREYEEEQKIRIEIYRSVSDDRYSDDGISNDE